MPAEDRLVLNGGRVLWLWSSGSTFCAHYCFVQCCGTERAASTTRLQSVSVDAKAHKLSSGGHKSTARQICPLSLTAVSDRRALLAKSWQAVLQVSCTRHVKLAGGRTFRPQKGQRRNGSMTRVEEVRAIRVHWLRIPLWTQGDSTKVFR